MYKTKFGWMWAAQIELIRSVNLAFLSKNSLFLIFSLLISVIQCVTWTENSGVILGRSQPVTKSFYDAVNRNLID